MILSAARDCLCRRVIEYYSQRVFVLGGHIGLTIGATSFWENLQRTVNESKLQTARANHNSLHVKTFITGVAFDPNPTASLHPKAITNLSVIERQSKRTQIRL
jgi:hypothetical protein